MQTDRLTLRCSKNPKQHNSPNIILKKKNRINNKITKNENENENLNQITNEKWNTN